MISGWIRVGFRLDSGWIRVEGWLFGAQGSSGVGGKSQNLLGDAHVDSFV